MELQAEAERRKRAQILESEGTSQAKINVAEAKKQEQILSAEALQTEVVLVAEARKKEVVLAAEGTRSSLFPTAIHRQEDPLQALWPHNISKAILLVLLSRSSAWCGQAVNPSLRQPA